MSFWAGNRQPDLATLLTNVIQEIVQAPITDRAGRLITNCNLLLIPDYMTKIVVSNIIRYITHFRQQSDYF